MFSRRICRVNRLSLVGKDSFEALHIKCLTLFGTCISHILFQKDLQPPVADELGRASLVSVASN